MAAGPERDDGQRGAAQGRCGGARGCPRSGGREGRSLLVSDRKARATHLVTAALGVSHEALNRSMGERVRGDLHVQRNTGSNLSKFSLRMMSIAELSEWNILGHASSRLLNTRRRYWCSMFFLQFGAE